MAVKTLEQDFFSYLPDQSKPTSNQRRIIPKKISSLIGLLPVNAARRAKENEFQERRRFELEIMSKVIANFEDNGFTVGTYSDSSNSDETAKFEGKDQYVKYTTGQRKFSIHLHAGDNFQAKEDGYSGRQISLVIEEDIVPGHETPLVMARFGSTRWKTPQNDRKGRFTNKWRETEDEHGTYSYARVIDGSVIRDSSNVIPYGEVMRFLSLIRSCEIDVQGTEEMHREKVKELNVARQRNAKYDSNIRTKYTINWNSSPTRSQIT